MLLLIKQLLKSSLKDKIQLVILIILVALSSILFVSSNTINQRLNSAYNYMGNGEFNYDYSFRYNSLLNYQNTQSIMPWSSFTDEKIEVYKKNPDQSYRLEYSLPTISIGAQPDDVLQALKAEYFTISTDGNYTVSFAPGYSMANIYSLNNINLTSKHFQNSLVGKLVNKISITTNDNLKQKYQKDLDNYFKVLQQAPTSFNILQLMQIYAKTNNTTDLNQIVNYLNDDNVTKWSQQIYLDKTDNQIPSNQQGDPNYLFTNKMGGMLGLLVYDNKRTNNNQTYSYFFESEFGTSLDSLSDPRNFASYQVGNLYTYNSSAKFFRIIDLFNTYSQILGDVNNFKIFNRHEYYAWDYQKNLKYKIINWEDLFANDQMRLFETYQSDPTWNQPGNNVYVVVSPSYQRLYNVKVGDAISLGDDQTRSLYVGAIGGDVGNIYPTIYDTDTIPNQQTEAIIYLNPVAYSQTLTKYFIGDSIKENSTAFLQSYGVDKQTDLKNFKYYLNDDFLHLNQNNYAQIKSNQETAAITNRNTMLGTVINIYQLINYGLMIFFYAILVLSLVFIMKKIINKRRVENGILKANGFSIYQIAASYLLYGIIISLIGGLAGWGLGLVMQIPIMNVFNKFFILPVNFTISGWSFLYNIIIALGLTIFIILLMGIIQLKDNPLKLIQPNSNLNSENKLTHLLKRIHFKKFTSRFKVILLSVSLKNIGLLFIVLLLATVGLTGAIIIPTSLKQVSQDYYKNLGYNNETNYNGIIGNNPLTGYQLYNWTGPYSADIANPTYPIRNNNVFPNYIKEYLYDKDGNTLDENGNIVPIGSAKKYWLDIWNLPPPAIKYYEDDLRNAVLYNFATARGTALSLGIFKALSDHYLDDDLNYTISTLLCTVVPTAFGKEPIPFDNTKPYESWRYCFSVATESIFPPPGY